MIHLSEDFSSSRLGNFVNFSLMVSKSEKKKKKKKKEKKPSEGILFINNDEMPLKRHT